MRTLTSLLTLSFACNLAVAVHFPVIGSSIQRRSLDKRADVLGSASLNNTNDVHYETNITLGGVSFTVLIDTGRCVCRRRRQHESSFELTAQLAY
jgi:predicted aspartyl protease